MLVTLLTAAGIPSLTPPAGRAAPNESASADHGATPFRPPDRTGTAVFRGLELPYVVIDGRAVHAGDMVLGRVGSLRSPAGGPRRPVPTAPTGPERRDTSSRDTLFRWSLGRIPYVIDSDISDRQRQAILGAIREWNNKTVISLAERTTESDFVRFTRVASGNCRADVGMIGGEQGIYLPPAGCSPAAVSHEIGHTVGLFHEHQRTDRNNYVTLLDENLDKSKLDAYRNVHPGSGPYDYASVMHYDPASNSSNGGYVMETVPPGLLVSDGRWEDLGTGVRLSQGDIDGVARFYGRVPKATSITTNPPGLDIVIDGVRVRTPARLAWKADSTHVLEAPSPQGGDATRYLFGRWNDEGERVRTVTITPETTWLEANFIIQHRIKMGARPARAGSVEVSPPSPDGYYTLRAPIHAVATAALGDGYEFWHWGGALRGQHGASSNPVRIHVDSPGIALEALFTTDPLFRIDATVDPLIVRVDGTLRYAPTALRVETASRTVEIEVDEVQRLPSRGLPRYRFKGWSDGGPMARRIVLPAQGGALTALVEPEYPLSTSVEDPRSGSLALNPSSADGHYRDGAVIRAVAEPAQGWVFVGWSGDAAGDDAVIEIEMDSPKHLEPVYSKSSSLESGVPESVVMPPMGSPSTAGEHVAQYRLQPAPGASEIRIGFQSLTPGSGVDLFVNAGWEPRLSGQGAAGWLLRHLSDFHLRPSVRSEAIVIAPDTQPRLDHDETYYVTLVAGSGRGRVRGKLVAEFGSSEPYPVGSASPRALAFVSPAHNDPAQQVIRLRNSGNGNLPYRIETNRPWLVVSPPSGVVLPGGSADLTVSVTAAGVLPDTHRARVSIHQGGEPGARSIEPLTVPVWFVVTPNDAGMR